MEHTWTAQSFMNALSFIKTALEDSETLQHLAIVAFEYIVAV